MGTGIYLRLYPCLFNKMQQSRQGLRYFHKAYIDAASIDVKLLQTFSYPH